MIKVSIAFPIFGSACLRIVNSMRKYLPKDIEIVQVLDRYTKFNPDYDLMITHCGAGAYYPHLAYVTPKLVISEVIDEVTMSYYREKDILFSYNHDAVDKLRQQGYNAFLWSRPVDPDIFYQEFIEKDTSVFSVGTHGDWVTRTDKVISAIGCNHLVAKHTAKGLLLAPNARFDICSIPKDNDRLRQNYCRSKYTMSIVEEYEYYPDVWSCGHETGNIEAVFCGSQPICLRPEKTTYWQRWLDGLAIFVDKANFAEEVKDILSGDYVPITEAQRQLALSRFSAPILWEQFWDAVRSVIL